MSVINLVLNGSGQAAFFGDLAGTGVESNNGGGIWAEDRSGVLKLIAREGDLLYFSGSCTLLCGIRLRRSTHSHRADGR